MKWISKVLNEALVIAQTTSLSVDARVYVTGARAPALIVDSVDSSREGSISADSPTDSPTLEAKLPPYNALQVTHGRPSVKKLLDEEITTSWGPVSVDGTSLRAIFVPFQRLITFAQSRARPLSRSPCRVLWRRT